MQKELKDGYLWIYDARTNKVNQKSIENILEIMEDKNDLIIASKSLYEVECIADYWKQKND